MGDLSIPVVHFILILFAYVTAKDVCSDFATPRGVIVDCNKRDLYNVPDNLPTNGVTALLLKLNNIAVIKRGSFSNFTELIYLDISFNTIFDLEPDAFMGLTKLERLDLSHNGLFAWPDQPLGALRSLTDLVLACISCKIGILPTSGPLPVSFWKIKQLTYIDMSVNKIENLSSTFVHNLYKENIQTLDMSRLMGKILTIDSETFGGFHSLRRLIFSGNDLSDTAIFQLFTGLDGLPLESLDLSFCKLKNRRFNGHILSRFTNNSLQRLDMCMTSLEYVDDGAFANLRHLRILALNYTFIHNIFPKTFLGMNNLKHLNLSGTNLDDFQADNATLGDLETLYISFKQHVQSLFMAILSGKELPQLKQLYIDNINPVAVAVSDIYSLEILRCTNCIIDIIQLRGLRSLQLIEVRFTFLTNIHPMFAGMYNLNIIYMSCMPFDVNLLYYIGDLGFNMSTLISLSLINCGIESVGVKTFHNLPNLIKLDLSRNTELILSQAAFSKNEKLRLLRLSYISGMKMLPGAVKMLNLRLLDVRNCGITWFSNSDMDYLASARFLKLRASGNPFYCSCELQTFIQWFKDTDKIGDNRSAYICSPSGIRVGEVKLFDCSHLVVILSVTLSAVVVCVVMVVLVYRYRWTLRWMWYLLRLKRYQRMEEEMENDPDIEYDAFISYSSCDYRSSFTLISSSTRF